MITIEYDFKKFNSKKYLEDYYSEISYADSCILRFLHDTYLSIQKGTMLEIGGGPTIYQLLAASARVDGILFAEFLKENRDEVLKFKNNDAEAFNWDAWIAYQLFLENKELTLKNREEMKKRIRDKIKGIIPCDLNKEAPIEPKEKFEIVSVNFCPESITDKEEKFREYMKKCMAYTKAGGLFVMCLLRNATSYDIEGVHFPAFPLDEKYVMKILEEEGFEKINMRAILFNDDERKDGNIMVSAIAPY